MSLRSEKIIFIIKILNLLVGSALKSNFWQYFNCVIEVNLIEFEIGKIVFNIKGLILLIGSASKSIFWQYFNCVIKGNLSEFEIGKNSFYYYGFKFIKRVRFEIQFLAIF